MSGRAANPSEAFLGWLSSWASGLETRSASDVLGKPGSTALMAVDMVGGFCREGPLASPRVAAVIPAVVELFGMAHRAGVRDFVLLQDAHSEDSPEFDSFGPHCIAGSGEAETIRELTTLPFSDMFRIIPKNSLSAAIGSGLDAWLKSNEGIGRFLITGDCTDLCVYQLAMYLKLSADACGKRRRVIVPSDCVETYDLPVERADELGVLPHDGALLHKLFLYHMSLNGIEVIAGVE